MAVADCAHCNRDNVRRSHGGVMVCPRCDLNEPEPSTPPEKETSRG